MIHLKTNKYDVLKKIDKGLMLTFTSRFKSFRNWRIAKDSAVVDRTWISNTKMSKLPITITFFNFDRNGLDPAYLPK